MQRQTGEHSILSSSETHSEDEAELSSEVLLSVVAHQGRVGLCFYDSKDCCLNFMVDTPDNELQQLGRVVAEVSPTVIVRRARQERYITQFLDQLNSSLRCKPEVVIYPNADFDLEVGKQRLLAAHLPFLSTSISPQDKFAYLSSCISFDSPLMMRAVGGLLKCLDKKRVGVELEDSSVGVPIIKIRAYTLRNIVFIDQDTYSALNIFKLESHPSVYKLQSGEREGFSLYGILNRCKSKFGSILLRQWFMRPTFDLNVLHRRQDVIYFFKFPRNSDLLTAMQSMLHNMRNIPSLLHKMSLHNIRVIDLQNLYQAVVSAVRMRNTARQLPQSIELFQEISEGFSDELLHIAILINRVVDFNTSVAENRFVLKPNVDPAVDEKKRMLLGLSGFLTNVARRELEQLDVAIPSCGVTYIPLFGFLLSVPRLPRMVAREDFEIKGLDFVFLSQDRLHYRSPRTKVLDELVGDLHCDIIDMETTVVNKLQKGILDRSASLYKVVDLLAELDCLMALTNASLEYGFTTPKLTNNRRISIMHGSLESEGRVKVITGPNSSGKSIYVKQVGLIVFMALIGSDVPVKEAEIGLVDGIFTCMPSRESVSASLSMFTRELNKMAQALNCSTGNSLVLIDEFGRGTNTVDGLSLLAACVSHWLRKAEDDVPHVLLATNFNSLLRLGLLPSSSILSPLTLETAVAGDELVFLYQLKEGVCQSSHAAHVAALAGLPNTLVQRAKEVSDLRRAGKPITQRDRASSAERAKRWKSVVDKFLSIDLDDKDLDLVAFLKKEISAVQL
ncbi:mutS protein homolog 5 isoform X2 [Synchiropus splendidus]|uniref:mutS protein homolog 5 isoform X2 n=1 Tax=Synchiropus splendidus TaxID=270530 RepID=UPI00237E1018|nr:mutS protein homolog 5 isoform X2 [Synchiropus splendidus]